MNQEDIETIRLFIPWGVRTQIARAVPCSVMTVDRALRHPARKGLVAERHRKIRQMAIEAGAFVQLKKNNNTINAI